MKRTSSSFGQSSSESEASTGASVALPFPLQDKQQVIVDHSVNDFFHHSLPFEEQYSNESNFKKRKLEHPSFKVHTEFSKMGKRLFCSSFCQYNFLYKYFFICSEEVLTIKSDETITSIVLPENSHSQPIVIQKPNAIDKSICFVKHQEKVYTTHSLSKITVPYFGRDYFFAIGSNASGQLTLPSEQVSQYSSIKLLPIQNLFEGEDMPCFVDCALDCTIWIAGGKVYVCGSDANGPCKTFGFGFPFKGHTLYSIHPSQFDNRKVTFLDLNGDEVGYHTMFETEDGVAYYSGRSENTEIPFDHESLGDDLKIFPKIIIASYNNMHLKKLLCYAHGVQTSCFVFDDCILHFGRLVRGDLGEELELPFSRHLLRKIVCSYGGIFLLKSDGSVYVYGDNICGELGIGNLDDLEEFHKIPQETFNNEAVVDIKCTHNTSIITEKGTVYTCGQERDGCLGYGGRHPTEYDEESKSFYSASLYPIAKEFVGNKRIHQVFPCYGRRFLVANDSTIFACGNNANNALGVDCPEDKTSRPHIIPFFENEKKFGQFSVKQICSGTRHTIFHIRYHTTERSFKNNMLVFAEREIFTDCEIKFI